MAQIRKDAKNSKPCMLHTPRVFMVLIQQMQSNPCAAHCMLHIAVTDCPDAQAT